MLSTIHDIFDFVGVFLAVNQITYTWLNRDYEHLLKVTLPR